MALTVLATYDIVEDSRRARVAAMLQMHGDRVQKSVFVLSLASEDLAELSDRIAAVIDTDADSFYVFHQCGECWTRVGCTGQATMPASQHFWILV